ncbi:uncharacterized protein [Blastocystis hominis]|uniref:Uncharacterized protein n=1 Tax=Blastocystis hominis TaxID=12968 RepID=D8M827_BLAHO|nr:uncharacterized protein [Blastocystis hominis]CBK24216.2 unnamed protein product [Blastocystis hominis]|eukprot:XP_012898264.1 uncharacterized protein [Blastocystis hominis]
MLCPIQEATILVANNGKGNLCSMQDAKKEIICFLQFDSSEKLQEMLKAQEKYGDLFKHEYRNEDPITTPSDFENNLRNVQYHFKSPIPTCYSNFMIYRTYRYLYLVAEVPDCHGDGFRLLKIELCEPGTLSEPLSDIIFDDERTYSKNEIQILLRTLHDGNKSMGGLTLVTSAKAILGFIRFVRCYYLVVVTETKPEGIIMGHVIYSITNSEVIPLKIEPSSKNKLKSLLSLKSEEDVSFPRGFQE